MANDPYSELFDATPIDEKKGPARKEPERKAEPAPRKQYADPYSELYETAPAVAAPVKKTAAEYSAMPWKEVLAKGGEEFIPSAGRALKAIPSAIYNYPETIAAIKKAGLGKVVESIVEPYKAIGKAVLPTSMGGDSGELKKMIAEDPYSILSTVPVGGAIGAVGKGLGAAGTLGRVAGAPLRAAGYVTSKVADPLGTIAGAGAGLAGLGPAAYRRARLIGTGVEDYPFEMAYKAGAAPSGDVGKAAFNQFASGSGDVNQFAIKAQNAAKAIRNQEISDWAKSKGAMTGAFTQPLPYTLVHQAIDNYRSTRLPPRGIGMASSEAAHDALDNIERNILKRQLPGNINKPYNTLAGFDQLKQELYDVAESAGSPMERNAILAAHHGVKDTLTNVAPEYENLMNRWREIDTNIKNITKSLGATDKVAANNALARFVKQQKTPEGRDLIAKLAEHEPELPYMAAGSVLHHDTARGAAGLGQALAFSQYLPEAWGAMMAGRPLESAKGLGKALLGVGMQSPSLMKDISYTGGQLSRVPPIPQIAAATKAAKAAYPLAYPAAYQIQNIEEQPAEEPRAYGGRSARATGGRINRGMTAQMLIAAVERAKANGQKTTESILNAPDEHVVQALKVANENI